MNDGFTRLIFELSKKIQIQPTKNGIPIGMPFISQNYNWLFLNGKNELYGGEEGIRTLDTL